MRRRPRGGGAVAEVVGAGCSGKVSAHDLPDDNACITRYEIPTGDTIFVTNPPWSRPFLHEIIVNLSNQAPAWLLLDADWVHTQLFRKSRRGLHG